MSVVRFWLEHRAEVAALLAQHVLLVLSSTLVAVAIGVPLGITAARRPRLVSYPQVRVIGEFPSIDVGVLAQHVSRARQQLEVPCMQGSRISR